MSPEFMRQNTQMDNSLRTAEPRFSTDGFDCEPPPGVIDELVAPKRARMLGRPVKAPRQTPPRWKPMLPFLGMLCWPILSIAALGAIMIAIQSVGRHAAPATQTSVSMPPVAAPIASATPSATPQHTPFGLPASLEPSVTVRRAEPVVRRAELVPVTVRRAELVSVPIGTSGPTIMPDGQLVVVTYRGSVPSFDNLPSDPQLGDMWHVTESNHDSVWCVPAGFASSAWLDP